MVNFENITLSQQIAQAIAIQISEGKLKPGDRLLENELTEQFGTSRAPIREALYILERDGIVERIPRRGVFVKKYTKKELLDLYDIYYHLQEIALLKVMKNATEQQINHLNHLVAQLENTIGGREIKNYFNLLDDLQVYIFSLSNNEVLKDLYLKIKNQLTPFRYISLSHPSSLDHSTKEYKEILMGLAEKDIEKVNINLRKKEKRALSILEKIVDSE
jgi:DNA-binding GntR family transcriptional regulator